MAKKKRKTEAEAKPAEDAPESSGSASKLMLAALAALAIGALAGWFARDARSEKTADASATKDAPPASSAACSSWADEVCKGADADACADAKTAAEMLPPSACVAAKEDVKATVEKLGKRVSKCDLIIEKVCADFGDTSESCKIMREKAPGFPKQQCAQMLDNYGALTAELKQMEEANAPISAEQAAVQRAGNVPGFGPEDAKLAIVEYSDFECGYCAHAAQAVKKVKEKYGDQVRFVFRQFPLSFHKQAQLAAEGALEAHAQGKFWAFHDLLFANQRALERESLEKYAKEAGLDLVKFNKALDDHTHKDAVAADMKLGEGIGVGGTPTMLVGTVRAPNPTEFEALDAVIQAELAKL